MRKVLLGYSWPGNVRELRNVIESMVVMDADGVLDADDLTEDLQQAASSGRSDGHAGVDTLVGKSLEEIERHYIVETLRLTGGNREEAVAAPRHRRADPLSQAQGIRDRLIQGPRRRISRLSRFMLQLMAFCCETMSVAESVALAGLVQNEHPRR